ncbi:hypothetical protein HAHE_31740 [Haloferula helveola]|uniref:histidine kinase n=1 Tax=Haloferula helveola TaxID=490095 RepID=A0ABM7RC47_9BACT|nr:hypothetical protein HAHE_31740 [Haloferula helveola]
MSDLSEIRSWAFASALAACVIAPADAADEAQSNNPIGRVARLLNPKLVEVEDRLTWLEERLRGLATFSPKPLSKEHGWRCASHGKDEQPSLTLDLGDTYPLSDIFLIPAQPQVGDARTLFPLRIRIETSLDPDFREALVIYDTKDKIHEDQDPYPLRVVARDIDARYVRLTVALGHFRGSQATAALSEMVVISGGEPVSFGAKVTSTHGLDSPGQWDAQYAVDGRSPLGVWEGGQWINSRGQIFEVEPGREQAEWIIDLGEPEPIDRIVAFPFQMPELGGTSALPGDIEVFVSDDPEESAAPYATMPGGETFAPACLPMNRVTGRYVMLRANSAMAIGKLRHHMLSEIEVWSQGRNLALEQPVRIRHSGRTLAASPEITDGYASGLKITPVGSWLRQLVERKEIEAELADLRPVRSNMATETELNATWGASIAIGLTFLIPVAFVERRRLVSRKQIDALRKRIASDLHDDIGSNLGSISLIARSAKRDLKRLQGPNELADDLDEVEVIARESSLAMRDIVWLLERRQDTIGDFVQRMRDCASRLLRDIDYTLVCRSNRTAAKMTLDAKRHLFLFYKEALHNVLKHSQASQVAIKIYDSKEWLVMEIEDNGIGLPTDAKARPAAVRKLTDRTAVLEGRLQVTSKPGQGTHLRLDVKRANLITATAAA